MATHSKLERRGLDDATHAIAAGFESITALIASVQTGIRAAQDFETLSSLSDEALAERGLTRAEISRAVFDTHFETRNPTKR